jgi:hypothetical protein
MFSQHPKMAKKWAKHTPNIKALPNRVSRRDFFEPGPGMVNPNGGVHTNDPVLREVAIDPVHGSNRISSEVPEDSPRTPWIHVPTDPIKDQPPVYRPLLNWKGYMRDRGTHA